MSREIREAIRTEVLARGFDAVGFAAAHLAESTRADLAEFLKRGYHGEMGWLAGKAGRRADPRVLWGGARTVVVLGVNYGGDINIVDRIQGNISVYARNCDYHEVIKKQLKSLGRWIAGRWPSELKVFVDTAPVM